jgi:hypothetical protein
MSPSIRKPTTFLVLALFLCKHRSNLLALKCCFIFAGGRKDFLTHLSFLTAARFQVLEVAASDTGRCSYSIEYI